MLTTLIAVALLGAHQQKLDLTCPVTGETITKPFAVFDYKGVQYDMCCPMCPTPFSKDPDKYLSPDAVKNRTVGVSYFDPVSGIAVKPNALRAKTDSVGPSVYNGVAYYFENADNEKTFEADPAKYTVIPAKEAIYCPVMKEEVGSLSHSGGYADVNGVRYYICCSKCAAMLKANPSQYLDDEAAKHVHDVAVAKVDTSK